MRLTALSKAVNIKVPSVFPQVLSKRSFGFRNKVGLMKSVFIAFQTDIWRVNMVRVNYAILKRVSVTSLEKKSHSALDFPSTTTKVLFVNSKINAYT